MDEALERGHISGDGEFTRRCSELLEREIGVGRALLTTSCTHALEMAAILLDIAPGDEVDRARLHVRFHGQRVRLRGARSGLRRRPPGHAEPGRAAARSEDQPADAGDRPGALRRRRLRDGRRSWRSRSRHGIAVVEDNAHGLFGRRAGRALGTFGELATLSFHETKNFICGEGGALLINDERYVERAEIVREKGTNRKRFFRGEVDKYTWVDIGSSYLPSDMLAAYLYGAARAEDGRARRPESRSRSATGELAEWAAGARRAPSDRSARLRAELPHVLHDPADRSRSRTRLIEGLRARGILSVFHYLPLHLSEMGRRWGGQPGDCPVSESVSERLVRLPFYTSLTEPIRARHRRDPDVL